jgi:hypothetical protein
MPQDARTIIDSEGDASAGFSHNSDEMSERDFFETRAATLIELCELTTSIDGSDPLAQPLFRPILFP